MIFCFISRIASHSYLKVPRVTVFGVSVREKLKRVHNAPDYKTGANDGGDVTASFLINGQVLPCSPIDSGHRNAFMTQQPAPAYHISRQIKLSRSIEL